MKLKLVLSFFVFLIFSTSAFSKPRCELFYEEVYSQQDYPRDVDLLTDGDVKHIGIRLLNEFNESKDGWNLSKTEDGYYIVGKVDKSAIVTNDPYDFDKALHGDIILEINNEDIRKSYDAEEFGSYISDAYEEDQEITLKLLRKLPNNQNKILKIKTTNEIVTYNQPTIDLFVNGLSLDEKEGVYEVSIETDFTEFLPVDFNITKAAHKYLVTKIEANEYPSKDEIEKGDWSYEECPFSESRWGISQSRDPAYGIKINNVVSEDKNKRSANYLIIPYFDTDYNDKKFQPYSQVIYKRISSYKIKNDFNLKSFPFDRQKIVLEVTNSRYDIDYWKAQPTTWSQLKGENFQKQNNITGWNIVNFNMNYKPFEDQLNETFSDGFELVFDVERKSRYYVFKVIFPIVLILIVCWSAVWITPREIESRLTITIVCLLSLIAYNFVIDKDLPKLEYLTIMDYIILISYVYATIPNFLSIITFNLIGKNKKLCQRYENYGKKYGLLSYLTFILLIIVVNTNSSPENTNAMLSWISPN